MAVIPAGYGQANLIFSGTNIPTGAQMVLGFSRDAGAGTATDYADRIYASFENNVLANLSSEIALDQVHVKFGPSATGPEGDHIETTAGGNAAAPDSPNVAILVKKVTASGGRANKGRFYCPGLTEDQTEDAGMLAPAVLAAFQSDWDGFYDQLIDLDVLPRVLHGPASPVTIPTSIISFSVDSMVATQRRRLRR